MMRRLRGCETDYPKTEPIIPDLDNLAVFVVKYRMKILFYVKENKDDNNRNADAGLRLYW